MREKRRLALLGVFAVVALAVQHPTADLKLLTHDAADPAPHRMQAAVDLGLLGISVLVTWSANRLAR